MVASAHVSVSLAIEDGPLVRVRAFAPWPSFPEDEIEVVTTVLRSGKVNYWTGMTTNIGFKAFCTEK
jgi:hypothetical protein